MATETKLDKAMHALRVACRRLDDEQGPRARRNARAAVKKALRAIDDAMDVAFPAPPRKVRAQTTSRLDRRAREFTELQRDGWTLYAGPGDITALRAVNSRAVLRDFDLTKRGNGRRVLVAGWALRVLRHAPDRLREFIGDPMARKAFLFDLDAKGTL